ncbi:hypothetical protein K1Y77_17220 (plasmid) [Halomonas qaidamensis]|uniref:DUF4376 domain-containing protein n=1 Tax=Halomonas qaidamensis TaxID=2866211 RepID=A0ABY6JWP0_9GAMM|nr:hypothetical protein [Halomonas qaidamensis]UYV20902.1 hypothetical protein K1Y77_17220 [Halomonas qaidamensis]
MLRDDMTPMTYRIRFLDNDIERTQYSDDRRYYEQLIAQHGHLSDLQIEPLTLTPEQQQRLDAIKGADVSAHDAGVYVQYGTTESDDTAFFDAVKLLDYQRAQVEPHVKAQRKKAEALGVTVKGVRYDGSPSNRNAIQEALNAVNHSGATEFPVWKCSDNHTHANHPASDVLEALIKIGQRRSVLIAKEAEYIELAAAGDADVMALDWATVYDN